MNIAYFINSLSNAAGMERIIIDKANLLSERENMRVFIVCLTSSDAEKPAFAVSHKVKVISLGLTFEPGNTKVRKQPVTFFIKWMKWRRKLHKAVRALVKEHNIDIAISSTYDAALPLSSKSCRLILESHAFRNSTVQLSTLPAFREFLTSQRVKKADALVALTSADAKLWKEAKRVEVIGNFTNMKPAGVYNPDIKRIMAAGRRDPQKGFDILVDAWRLVARHHPDWSLDIYGGDGADPNIRIDLQSKINEAGLSHSITLCGVCNDMPAAYAAHSVFVLSSRYEGFGLVLLEAITCGVPCVSFDCPYGPSDIITDGEDGLLVPFNHLSDTERAEKLAEALCRIIEDRDMRCRMSQAAIRKADTFSRDKIIDRWVELFKSVMNQ